MKEKLQSDRLEVLYLARNKDKAMTVKGNVKKKESGALPE